MRFQSHYKPLSSFIYQLLKINILSRTVYQIIYSSWSFLLCVLINLKREEIAQNRRDSRFCVWDGHDEASFKGLGGLVLSLQAMTWVFISNTQVNSKAWWSVLAVARLGSRDGRIPRITNLADSVSSQVTKRFCLEKKKNRKKQSALKPYIHTKRVYTYMCVYICM